jgi:hypothetical protein
MYHSDGTQIIKLDDFLERTFISIELLLERCLFNQVLIIMYSAIDTMAWSCRAEGDSNRSDFYTWCADFMPCEDLGITALDLYAARCSILHSNSSHSDSTENGPCLPFLYVMGKGTVPLDHYSPPTARESIVVDLDVLLGRFSSATRQFRQKAARSGPLRDIVSRRMEQWLQFTLEE